MGVGSEKRNSDLVPGVPKGGEEPEWRGASGCRSRGLHTRAQNWGAQEGQDQDRAAQRSAFMLRQEGAES